MAIDVGDVHPLTVEVRDANGALANAGSVALTIRLPDMTTVTPSITNPTPGRYQADYTTVQTGRHEVRWVATGANASAYADTFYVSETYPRYLVSLARTKKQLRITKADEDEEIRSFIESATEVVERHTGRAVVRRTEVEDHQLGCSKTLVLKRSPVISLISVARVDGTHTWNVGDLYLSKTTGIVTVKSAQWFSGHVEAAYVAGPEVVAANEVDAAAMIVQHLWLTRRGQRGGIRPGQMEDTVTIPGMGFAVPRAALELLGSPPPLVA